jgi:methylglutamate dehydrogenase subunit D
VADFTLTATSALGGYDRDHDGIRLRELTDLAIVSVALPLGGEADAAKAIESALGSALPPVGQSVMSADRRTRLARLGRDQLFVFFTNPQADAEQVIAAKLNRTAYTTDQSDTWVALEISGLNARAALARICPLDLHPDAFATGSAARTVMEHLGTLILRTGPDTFTVLSASSSAGSFLHALKVSVRNVI